ncbi:hypothetical protein D3C72_1487220 [compost metagenome]
MSLSFKITSRLTSSCTPALFIASNAMPAVIEPSPITAIACSGSPLILAACAMPSAAEIDVDECAVPKVSYSLSSRFGKPEMPSFWRKVCMRSRRPVSILCE